MVHSVFMPANYGTQNTYVIFKKEIERVARTQGGFIISLEILLREALKYPFRFSFPGIQTNELTAVN